MSQVYWKKAESGSKNTQDTPVTEATPLPVRAYKGDGEEAGQDVLVTNTHLPPVAGETIKVAVEVPGIGTASAYAAGDAFGTLITLHGVFRRGKNAGTIVKAVLADKDDEGIQKDLMFFERAITTTADNAAYAPSDEEILASEGGLSITTFFNLSSNQIGQWTGSLWVKSQDANLYVRLVTQGADNIAAGALPWLILWIIPD